MEDIITYTDMEISIKKQQTITAKVDNEVWQSRLCLWAFVSVGEALLFILKYQKYIMKVPNGLQTDLTMFY
jgi:hypothetical protein